jgi:hypothetical protein
VLLGALVLLLALTLAGPVRQYVAGRQELAQLAADHQDLAQQAADLQAQLDRQADPAYVAQQARERLTYVLPGDRLVVVGDAGAAGDAVDAAGAGGKAQVGRSRPGAAVPWYTGLLDSLAAADGNPPASPAGPSSGHSTG